MPVAPSFSDLVTAYIGQAQYRRPDLAFVEGDVTVADAHGSGIMADAVLRFAWQAFRDTFIDGAEKDALSALVNDRLNIQRFGAEAAVGSVRFTRTSGGAGGTIPAGTRVGAAAEPDGAQVVVTTNVPIVVGAANNGPFDVAVTAQQTGPEGNVAAAGLTRIMDVLFDSTFSVTNPTTMAGGNAAEEDPALRERARAFYGTLRRGTLAALEFGAKQAVGVSVATAREDDAAGLVYVTVSDSSGNSNAQLIAAAVAELENWRAAGVNVEVLGGTRTLVDLTISLVVRVGFDVAAQATLLQDAVAARIDGVPAENGLYLDTVIAAIIGVFPDEILDVQFNQVVRGGVTQAANTDPIPAGTGVVLRAGTISITEAAS